MVDLFDDFRALLVELHDAGARFVVVGGHAVALAAGRKQDAADVEALGGDEAGAK